MKEKEFIQRRMKELQSRAERFWNRRKEELGELSYMEEQFFREDCEEYERLKKQLEKENDR